jgi:hypothetical protein
VREVEAVPVAEGREVPVGAACRVADPAVHAVVVSAPAARAAPLGALRASHAAAATSAAAAADLAAVAGSAAAARRVEGAAAVVVGVDHPRRSLRAARRSH